MQHPWHDISIGNDAPKEVTAIIEIPNGSKTKYELDKDSGFLKLDRVLYSSMHYPANYGFIPKTYCDDGDPLDILVISQSNMQPMCLVEAKVVGAMKMIDGGEMDDKIIAVAARDMRFQDVDDLNDLNEHYLREIKSFFEDYKKLEEKSVEIKEFLGKDAALQIVEDSIKMYNDKF